MIVHGPYKFQCSYRKRMASGEWRCAKDTGHKGNHEPSLVKTIQPTGTSIGQ